MPRAKLSPVGVPGTEIDDKPRRGYIMLNDGDGYGVATWTWVIIVINRDEVIYGRKPRTEDEASACATRVARELGITLT